MICLNDVEKPAESNPIEQKQNDEQTSSLFDEVMQAFTDIYTDHDMTGKWKIIVFEKKWNHEF